MKKLQKNLNNHPCIIKQSFGPNDYEQKTNFLDKNEFLNFIDYGIGKLEPITELIVLKTGNLKAFLNNTRIMVGLPGISSLTAVSSTTQTVRFIKSNSIE